jgi:hypothetical protein
MGSSVIPVPSSGSTGDAWTLISSVTPTAGASTVSFTGISGYKKLAIRNFNTVLGTIGKTNLTFNGDTGANYAYNTLSYDSSSPPALVDRYNSLNAANILFYNTNTTATDQYALVINDTNNTTMKTFSGFGGLGNAMVSRLYPMIQGMYFGSAAITSVTITTTTTFTAVGTVALYGVAA